jgi:exonuclease VII small subunit
MASNGEYVVKASAVQKYGPRFLDALNSGSLPAFATGGSVTKAEQSARNSAASQFDISFFGRIAGYKHNPFEKSLEAAASLGDLVSTLNKWRSTIKAALSGVQETRLLDHLTNVGRSLIKHEKALDKVNEALTKAKDKLSSLKDAAAQLKDSVKSGIISGANITGTAQSTGLTSTGRIMDQLTMDRDKAKALADSLKQLKSMGLNSQSLSEIAQAGVSGGGLATAQALLSASGGQIDQINSLEKQLKASADSSGKTTASAVYAASIKHADKVVKALEKHQASLEKAIEKMTKALEKLITKALGIKHHASGGAAGGASWINEMGAELVHLPDGSTVYPAGQSRQMAMAGGGSDAPIVINLEVGGRHFEQLWVDTGRRVVRTRGGNVQAALGRPGS